MALHWKKLGASDVKHKVVNGELNRVCDLLKRHRETKRCAAAKALLGARKRLDKERLKDVMWELITEVRYYSGCQMGWVSV